MIYNDSRNHVEDAFIFAFRRNSLRNWKRVRKTENDQIQHAVGTCRKTRLTDHLQ